MSIAYLPSEGGINKVGLTGDYLWYGDSIGGKILDRIKVKKFADNGSYFNYYYSNLDASSRWFFKDVTEYNFLNGVTIYRCMYIGADERFKETEVLGNIACSITHNGPNTADNSVTIDMAVDGKFTVFTSQNTTVLETEQDPTDILASRNDWTTSLVYNDTLKPGEYLKVWIRLQFANNATFLNVTDYDYFVTIKDLTIPMRRTNGRMPMSKMFSMSLDKKDYILYESIPKDVDIQNIYKVIDNGKYLNIFYIEGSDIKLLIVKQEENPDNSKYIDINISTFVPEITANNQFLSNFSQCFTQAITGTDSPSSSGTSGTSGSPESVSTTGYPVDYPDISYDYDSVVGKKFLVDILGTEKPDRNDFYLFFNTFLSDTSDEYIEKYGHKNYYWNCGVVHINLNHINDVFFSNIEAGYANVQSINLIEQYTEILNNRFFINSITMKDDLLTGVGYIPEDCRIINNKTKLFYVWEGDIVNRKTLLQMFDIPSSVSTVVNTIENAAGTDPYLTFDDTHVNLVNFGHVRSTRYIDDGIKFVAMGPATQSAFHHGLSPVTYDMTNTSLDQFASTWAFGISTQSISLISAPSTVDACDFESVSVSAADIPDAESFDSHNPNHWHLMNQSDFDSFYSGSSTVKGSDYKINIVDKNLPIFNIHCLGNQDLSAMKAVYNFKTKKWILTVNDETGEPYEVIVEDVPLIATAENTITVNLYRQLDYGCAKKYIIHIEIWVNGRQLFTGISYTRYTNDTFTITHNYEGEFAGWLSYWDIRKYIETNVDKYAIPMFQIFSNIAWAELEAEIDNVTEVESLKMFNFKRNILMRNLSWGSKESIVIPIVLQGNGYNISDEYNVEVRRSVFNFNRIDINQKSFAFTLEGSSNLLEWVAGKYDIERDILVVWVRVDNWDGQRITMYYSDSRVIQTKEYQKPYRDDWYAAWHMNNNIKIPRTRFVSQKVFHAGEHFVNVTDSTGNEYLIRVDKQYVFGYADTYMSNKFDIQWDDRTTDINTTNLINDFIRTQVKNFKPSFMEIRNVDSTFPYKLEGGDNNTELRGEQPADSSIVTPQGPTVICR